MGGRLFASNCSVCHGSDAKGAFGFPNLADSNWRWGGDAEMIKTTIMGGRMAAMPAWGEILGDAGVKNVAAYVRHELAGLPLPADNGADLHAGQQAFSTMCVACHGANGQGTEAMGAPNLTQPAGFIYGTSLAQLQQTIRHGRQGHMPAQNELLGNDKVQLLAAYVYSLSQGLSTERLQAEGKKRINLVRSAAAFTRMRQFPAPLRRIVAPSLGLPFGSPDSGLSFPAMRTGQRRFQVDSTRCVRRICSMTGRKGW